MISWRPLQWIREYQDLILYLVRRDLTVRYRRSVIGFLWSMLQPLLHLSVLYFAFAYILGSRKGAYAVYVLAGLLFWNFFSQSITASMNSLAANRNLMLKVPLPKAVFPLSTALSGVVNLFFSLVPLMIILVVVGHPFRPSLFFLPVSILLVLLFTLGAGLALAPLSVFFTDVVELVRVVLQLTFFLVPIIYPMEIIPADYRWVVRFNPIRSILEVFRDPIYYGKVPPLSHLAVAVSVALLALAIGTVIFRKSSDRIPYYF